MPKEISDTSSHWTSTTMVAFDCDFLLVSSSYLRYGWYRFSAISRKIQPNRNILLLLYIIKGEKRGGLRRTYCINPLTLYDTAVAAKMRDILYQQWCRCYRETEPTSTWSGSRCRPLQSETSSVRRVESAGWRSPGETESNGCGPVGVSR